MQVLCCLIVLIFMINTTVFAHTSKTNWIRQNVFHYIGQPSGQQACLATLGGYRLYNTCKAQFLKQDAYSPFYDQHTLNGFNYAAGNPVIFVDISGHSPTQKLKGLLAQCIGRNGNNRQKDSPKTDSPIIDPNIRLGNEIDQLRATNKKLRTALEEIRTNHTRLQVEHTQLHDKYTKIKKQLEEEGLDIADESPTRSVRTPKLAFHGQRQPKQTIDDMFDNRETLFNEIETHLNVLDEITRAITGPIPACTI